MTPVVSLCSIIIDWHIAHDQLFIHQSSHASGVITYLININTAFLSLYHFQIYNLLGVMMRKRGISTMKY